MKPIRCPTCQGRGSVIGTLGDYFHYRCNDCGTDWQKQRMRPSPRVHAKQRLSAVALARMYPGRKA